MSVVEFVSTADLPEADRMAFWVEAICETFLELKVDSTAGRNFHGAIETHALGPLTTSFLAFDNQFVQRTRQGISRGKRSEFYLLQARDRSLRLSQLGREIDLAPGGCTLLDSRYPYTIHNQGYTETITVSMPTAWLLTWLPAPEEIVAQPWQLGKNWGGVLAAALANLNPTSIACLPVLPSVFCDQIGAMIAMASADGASPPVRVRRTLVDRLRDTLKSAFHDALLCPEQVARHHGISLRYLHLQFAAAGTSFGAELLRIRLDNAKRLLDDPRSRRLSVTELSLRCGFSNSSHFARRFRERFGLSPSELRIRRHQ